MFYGSINGMKHDLLAIAFATLSSDDSAYRNFFHVSIGRAYTSQGNNFVCYGQPQVDGFLVIPVHVLIDAVLLNHEYLATYSQEFVQFIRSQFLKRFFMQNLFNVHKII